MMKRNLMILALILMVALITAILTTKNKPDNVKQEEQVVNQVVINIEQPVSVDTQEPQQPKKVLTLEEDVKKWKAPTHKPVTHNW